MTILFPLTVDYGFAGTALAASGVQTKAFFFSSGEMPLASSGLTSQMRPASSREPP